MTTSARAAASAAVTATAPGVRTSTVRAILAGSPEPAMSTSVAGRQGQSREHGADFPGTQDADCVNAS